jgi:hypothetical protein
MKAESDKTLDPPADDPVRRQAVAAINRQRHLIFLAAIIVTGCAVFMNLTHKRDPHVRGFTDIGAVLLWLMVFRIGAKLRALTGEEPTAREKDEKAAALVKSWRPPAKT